MTVASTTNRKTFAGNGVTTSFGTSPVVFFDTADLTVYVTTDATGVSTTLVENTDYTVSGGDGSTGTVSLAGGSAPYGAPATGKTLVIVRELDLVQETDFQNNDASDAENVEDALDRLTMMAQQVSASVGRVVRLDNADVSGADVTLPFPEADKVIGWSSTGLALENKTAADIDVSLVSPFAATLLDDANARAFIGTLYNVSVLGTMLSDKNDYAISTTLLAHLGSDAARNMTGIVAGVADGQLLTIHNSGAFVITLKDESGSSVAANRFALNGDYPLAPDTAVLLQYEMTSARWRVVGQQTSSTEDTSPDPINDFLLTWDVSALAHKRVAPYRFRCTQAQAEDSANDTSYLTPYSAGFHPCMPKAWGLITPNTTVTAAFPASGVSVSKTSTGFYVVTHGQTFSSVNYAIFIQPVFTAGMDHVITARDATTFTVKFYDNANTIADPTAFSYSCFGDI